MSVGTPDNNHDAVSGPSRQANETVAAVESVPTITMGKSAPPHATDVPKQIGQYRILRAIASGGMGTVYEAEQYNPKRTVALKVIRHGLATPNLLRRFELESEVLGRLQHPGIAQIYEAGTANTDAGAQPFFAMEFVRGLDLKRYISQNKLTISQRLDLLARLCDAVQHAHQKGVIHRDLKPGNILVDESGQPKILDFGVARATDSDKQITTMQSDVGQLIGTIQYMSPEQVSADPNDIDTRSDIYALGVITFEVLTGRPPYDLKNKMIHEAARIIREETLTKPSTINRTLHGDIETIIGKALQKEKHRRYQSAAELAADIRHYLNAEPIAARPPSAAYQLKKFAQRNKALVGGLVSTFLVLIAGVVGIAIFARLEFKQRVQAEEAKAEAETVTGFLTEILSAVHPEKQGKEITVREILDGAAERVKTDFAEKPLVQARLHTTIGSTYRGLGLFDEAKKHLSSGFELYDRIRGPIDQRTMKAAYVLGVVLQDRGEYDAAEKQLMATLEQQRSSLGREHQDTVSTMSTLATVYLKTGRLSLAKATFQSAIEVGTRVDGAEHMNTLKNKVNLADVYEAQGGFAEAESRYLEVLEVIRRTIGVNHPFPLQVMDKIGRTLFQQRRLLEAETIWRETLASREQILGATHFETLDSVNNLAALFYAQGKYSQAEPLLTRAILEGKKVYGEGHPFTLSALNNLASLYKDQERYTEAEPLYLECLDRRRSVLGEQHVQTLGSMNNLADLYRLQGRFQEARPLATQAVETAEKALPPGHYYVAGFRETLGQVLVALGSFEEAEQSLLKSHAGFEAARTFLKEQGVVVQALVTLYESWDAAEPGKGYDAKAADWKAKRDHAAP